MQKDFGSLTIHANRYYLNNFAVGIDFYQLKEWKTDILEASVLQLSFLFFNVTFTKWHRWI
jgi:hypothetical protein